jgi:hypothetical protein
VDVVLVVWPALPVTIIANTQLKGTDPDSIIGALKHRDRIAGIELGGFNCSQLKKCMALMQKPFPVLNSLLLDANEKIMFDIPDTFLGGSAPLLQMICLHGIQFPGLPKLLSSTSNLVRLVLRDILMTGEGHISPDAMITCLSVLTKLQSLIITSLRQDSSPYPTAQRLPSSAHTVLPALTYLWFRGRHECLEDIVG